MTFESILIQDDAFMRLALAQAEQAEQAGEVPVGAVMVYQQQVIASAYNQPISQVDPTAHAEIVVLRRAAQALGNYRLVDTCIYVTLEPCPMCAAALVHARVGRIVYATADLRTGACGSVMNLAQHAALNHQIQVESGILADVAKQQLQRFFQTKRKRAIPKESLKDEGDIVNVLLS